jgi:hypothetical protein
MMEIGGYCLSPISPAFCPKDFNGHRVVLMAFLDLAA